MMKPVEKHSDGFTVLFVNFLKWIFTSAPHSKPVKFTPSRIIHISGRSLNRLHPILGIAATMALELNTNLATSN